MKKWYLLLALFFCWVCLSAQTLVENTITVDGLEREYLVYVPAAYDGSEAWPLVLNLHPSTLNAQAQMALSLMNPVADTAHFIVVYPNGIAPTPDPNVRFWNPLLFPDRQDDVSFLDQLIDTLVADFNVEMTKVYLTGGSEGAIMTYSFACEMPEKIAAIATVGSVLPDSFDISGCVPPIPLPLLHIHGTADPIGPFEGGIDGAGNLAPPVRNVIGDWLLNNGCTLDSTVVNFPDIDSSDSSTVSRIAFSNCNSYLNANQELQPLEVWFYVVENGGHNYPGGGLVPDIFGPINRDISASSEIWNFFNRHTLASTSSPTNTVTPTSLNLTIFPNPTTFELNFQFELQQGASVKLDLFNVMGQKVETILHQNLSQGKQKISWSRTPNSIPSGIYYYQLQIDNQFISQALFLN